MLELLKSIELFHLCVESYRLTIVCRVRDGRQWLYYGDWWAHFLLLLPFNYLNYILLSISYLVNKNIHNYSAYHNTWTLLERTFLYFWLNPQCFCRHLILLVIGSHHEEIWNFSKHFPPISQSVHIPWNFLMQNCFTYTVSECITVLPYHIVRVSWKFLTKRIDNLINFFGGQRSLTQQYALPEIGMISFGCDFHNASMRSFMTCKSILCRCYLNSWMIDTETNSIEWLVQTWV